MNADSRTSRSNSDIGERSDLVDEPEPQATTDASKLAFNLFGTKHSWKLRYWVLWQLQHIMHLN